MIALINNRTNRFVNMFEKHIGKITVFVFISYFVCSFANGLLKGGRWDLYQAIAIADRYLSGKGFYYSTIEASTPYFPGISFLSVFVGRFFYEWRDYIMLFIASVVGSGFMYVLVILGKKVTKYPWIPLFASVYAAFLAFPNYRSYMNEFKADSLIMIFAFLIILIINKTEENTKRVTLLHLTGMFILSFLMNITKQQALYIDVGIGLYLLFAKKILLINRIKLLMPIALGGILDIFVLFSIPGLEIQAIQNLSAMPYWSIKEIIFQLGFCFLSHLPFFLVLFYFVFLCMYKKVKLDKLNTKWLIISICVGLGQIVGGMKTGGNTGNYEVGMIAFLPFTMMAVQNLFEEYFIQNKKIFVQIFCIICVILVSLGSLAFAGRGYITVIEKIKSDNIVSEYLSKKCEGKTIMYYSDQYMQVARSTAIPGMDVYSVPLNLAEYWDVLGNALNEQRYEFLYIDPSYFEMRDVDVFTYFGYKTYNAEYLDVYYEFIQDTDIPEALKGKLFQAKHPVGENDD